MRVSIVLFLIMVGARMIYDLTFNPVEAIVNIVYKNGSESKAVRKQIAKITLPFIAFAIIWNLVMPGIMAYHNQPFEEETHKLSQMPMYGNKYIETVEPAIGSTYYRYMISGDTECSETSRGAKTMFVRSDVNQNLVNIIYQNPRIKDTPFIFMDALTWPKQRKDVEYTFTIVFE